MWISLIFWIVQSIFVMLCFSFYSFRKDDICLCMFELYKFKIANFTLALLTLSSNSCLLYFILEYFKVFKLVFTDALNIFHWIDTTLNLVCEKIIKKCNSS